MPDIGEYALRCEPVITADISAEVVTPPTSDAMPAVVGIIVGMTTPTALDTVDISPPITAIIGDAVTGVITLDSVSAIIAMPPTNSITVISILTPAIIRNVPHGTDLIASFCFTKPSAASTVDARKAIR